MPMGWDDTMWNDVEDPTICEETTVTNLKLSVIVTLLEDESERTVEILTYAATSR